MRIAIMTADFPDVISGVGDYSFRLREKLDGPDDTIFLITTDSPEVRAAERSLKIRWNLRGLFTLIRFLKEEKIRLVNIQYPCLLYGKYSIYPQVYAVVLRLMGFGIVTTLHEFSNINVLRRISEYVFIFFSQRVVVTNEHDRREIGKRISFIRYKVRVIPIGSNISRCNVPPRTPSRYITYFGLAYPNKNAARVIDIMKEIEDSFPGAYVFKFVMGTHNYYPEYMKTFMETARGRLRNTEWHMDLPLEQIGDIIADTFCAVLYYADGATVRRTTLLSFIHNGIPVITNKSEQSVELAELKGRGIFYVDNNLENCKDIMHALSDKLFYNSLYYSLINFSERFSFEEISRRYSSIFHDIP